MNAPDPPNGPTPDDAAVPPGPPRATDATGERQLPRGCNPLVFGVVMATLQFALTAYFAGWCERGP